MSHQTIVPGLPGSQSKHRLYLLKACALLRNAKRLPANFGVVWTLGHTSLEGNEVAHATTRPQPSGPFPNTDIQFKPDLP